MAKTWIVTEFFDGKRHIRFRVKTLPEARFWCNWIRRCNELLDPQVESINNECFDAN